MRFVVRYFDAFVEPLFKRDAQGRTVFFLGGKLASGRILPDDAAADRLRTVARRAYMVAFLVLLPILVVLGLALGWTGWRGIAAGAVGGGVIGGMLLAWLWWHVRGLPRSEERLTFAEAQAVQSRVLGAGWIKALFFTSLVLALGSLASLLLDPGANIATGLTGLVLFGSGTILFWRQWQSLGASATR